MKLFKYPIALTDLVNDEKLCNLITGLITWLFVITTFNEGVVMSKICSF